MKEEQHHHIDGETCAHHGCNHVPDQSSDFYDDGVRARLRMTKSKPKIDRKATKAKRKQKHR